jgi:hypothetical protein
MTIFSGLTTSRTVDVRSSELIPGDGERGDLRHEWADGLHHSALHREDPLDVPVHHLRKREEAKRLRRGSAVDYEEVIPALVDVALDIDQAEDLVQPGDDGELLCLDGLHPGPVHQLDEVLLDLPPVCFQPGLGVDLLCPQAPSDRGGLVHDVAIEGVGERMRGVGTHDQRPGTGSSRLHGGRGGNGGLAHAALSREEQDSHLQLA